MAVKRWLLLERVRRSVGVHDAAVGRDGDGARERHLRVLREPRQGARHVVRGRQRGGTRSQVPGARRRYDSPAGCQRGEAVRRGRGEGGVP